MRIIESNNVTDNFLLCEVEKGNSLAFDKLFDRYWDFAYNMAYKRLKNQDDSKDVVQEIFTHIWVNRCTKRIENLPAYLNISVRNKVLKLVSSKKSTHPFYRYTENLPAHHTHADSQLLQKEFSQSYEEVIQTLPAKRQEVFRMRFNEDMPTKEIADRLGLSQKTVQNQLGKAIETIKGSMLRIISTFL